MKSKKRYIDSGRIFTYKSKYSNDDPNQILSVFKNFLEEMKGFKKIKNIVYGIKYQSNYTRLPESGEVYERKVAEYKEELAKKRIALEEQAKEMGLKLKPVKDVVPKRDYVVVDYPDLPSNVPFKTFCENIINHLEKHKDIDTQEHYIHMNFFVEFDGQRLEDDYEYSKRVYHERLEKAKLKRTEKENKIRELKSLARQMGVELVKA
jgi:hypothetical protein